MIIFIIALTNSTFGQGINNLWLMGYGCCSASFNPMNLDFSTGSLDLTLSNRPMNINVTNAEICDSRGNLLFYTNGIYVANSNDSLMLNGDSLNPSFFTANHETWGLTLPQGNLIIPFPGDSMKYYLFHQTIDDFLSYASLNLYYSIIDMNLDGGLGGLSQKNTILLTDSLIPGKITGCKHANGRDWWIFVHQFHTGNIYKYLITPLGIQGPWVQDLFTYRDIGIGQVVFSPQGDKFSYYDPYDDLDIWDFDRCTGDFSNFVHIEIDDTAYSAGVAFSPSGRFLYVSSDRYLYQFDMSSTNIDSSRTTIGVYDNYVSGGLSATFYLAALAPDNKIYINVPNSSMVLHTIEFPDSLGLLSNFCQHCISLPAYNGFTIPNHPNYFLQAQGNTVCDSLISNTGTEIIESNISIFPNPAKDRINISSKFSLPDMIDLRNSMGQSISVRIEKSGNNFATLILDRLSSGVYVLILSNRESTKNFRIIVE